MLAWFLAASADAAMKPIGLSRTACSAAPGRFADIATHRKVFPAAGPNEHSDVPAFQKRHSEHALEISLPFRPGAGRLIPELAGDGRSSDFCASSNGAGGERVRLLEFDQGQ